MKKVIIAILVIAILVAGGVFAYIKINEKNSGEETANTNSSTQRNGIDYLVIVNKQNKLPDDWEKNVQLVTVKNAFDKDIQLEKEAYEKYKELKAALEKEGVHIELDSCYRSVAAQQDLWDRWTVEKGIDYVKKYVAVPGYSEHHTGLAVDICLNKDGKIIDENDDMIADRETFAKIHAKLADYGFILRYLENRDDVTGYSYEPWHLRYVGSEKIAKEIMDKNITFEEYLGNIKNIKETPSAAKYQIAKTLQEHLKNAYGDKITNSRFNVIRIYSDEEVNKDEIFKSLNLGKNDIPFEVEYQLLPAKDEYINELMIPNGEYDKNLGWVKNISRLGVLKYNEINGSYSITNLGTGW